MTTLPKLDREYKVPFKGKVMRKMSVGSFCKLYNKGTYFLRTVNTAVAVRDGLIIMGVPNNKKGIVKFPLTLMSSNIFSCDEQLKK